MSQRELECRIGIDYYEVQLHPAVGVSESLYQTPLVGLIVEAAAFQVLDIEVDWRRSVGSDRGFQSITVTR